MSTAYVAPLGLPLHWRNDQSRLFHHAIESYLKNRTEGVAIRPVDFELLKAYLCYFIDAPCWDGSVDDLASLRSGIREAGIPDEIDSWIESCLEIGIDPL